MDLPNGGVDLFGNCLLCGHHVPSTNGCGCRQVKVETRSVVSTFTSPRRRTFVVTVEEVKPEPTGWVTTTIPPYEIVW